MWVRSQRPLWVSRFVDTHGDVFERFYGHITLCFVVLTSSCWCRHAQQHNSTSQQHIVHDPQHTVNQGNMQVETLHLHVALVLRSYFSEGAKEGSQDRDRYKACADTNEQMRSCAKSTRQYPADNEEYEDTQPNTHKTCRIRTDFSFNFVIFSMFSVFPYLVVFCRVSAAACCRRNFLLSG